MPPSRGDAAVGASPAAANEEGLEVLEDSDALKDKGEESVTFEGKTIEWTELARKKYKSVSKNECVKGTVVMALHLIRQAKAIYIGLKKAGVSSGGSARRFFKDQYDSSVGFKEYIPFDDDGQDGGSSSESEEEGSGDEEEPDGEDGKEGGDETAGRKEAGKGRAAEIAAAAAEREAKRKRREAAAAAAPRRTSKGGGGKGRACVEPWGALFWLSAAADVGPFLASKLRSRAQLLGSSPSALAALALVVAAAHALCLALLAAACVEPWGAPFWLSAAADVD
ncbi:hypothetical protein HYH03_006641 [Edaphochlamys debaryana]|uniref:Uncharacterized protein n=1 Tax=Edaphochlamys debaryana TaxID=47281 RepID=A0A836C197_9CHLO|nr:hypothetical protein HYH03_006641 [Edaphochlamys debaryana]|eukprot:KAG2495373.1 hypothetical protein HYH03_006641 [Edaphochlamys debaryana]